MNAKVPKQTQTAFFASLSTKLTLAYSILILIIAGVLALSLYVQAYNRQRTAISDRLRDILNFSIPLVSGTYHSLVTTPDDETKAAYHVVLDKLQSILTTSGIIKRVYTIRQKPDGSLEYVIDANPDQTTRKQVGDTYTGNPSLQATALSNLKSAVIEDSFRIEPGGTYLEGYVPIFDESHRLDGALVIDIDASSITAGQIQDAQVSVLAFLATAPLALLIGWWLGRRITAPIQDLVEGAQRMAHGQLDQPVPIRGRDELGILAEGFNEMSEKLSASYTTLENRVKERTRELEQARKEAESASSAKSLFLSNMSHELRAPLNMVIGYTSAMLDMPQMYKHETLPDLYRSDIEVIRANGQYLLGLINDILDLSKIEAGKFDLEFTATDLIDIFQGIIATSLGLVKGKPVQIRPNFPETLPLIWGDGLRVRQILLNLMSNAIKFTNTGSVTLAARVNGGHVQVSVIDTGIGIPKEALNVIFDRFQQIQNKVKIQGTGLGLDICQHLAQMHGTKVTVESTVGQGSTFSFDLPIATPVQLAQSTNGIVTHQDSGIKLFDDKQWDSTAGLYTILLIEDDGDTRLMLHHDLESVGHVVIDVNDSAQVMELASGLLPDLIILDVTPPVEAAWKTLNSLKTDTSTSTIPVIVLTEGSIYETARKLEAGQLLRKPVNPNDILKAMAALLDHRI